MQINVTQYLDQTVQKFREKVAVHDCNGSLSFYELYCKALGIAEAVCNIANVTNSPICVYLPKSKEAVTCFAGINYSGNFYVPLDVKSPLTRIKNIIETLSPILILSDKKHFTQIASIFDESKVVCFEDIESMSEIEKDVRKFIIDTDPIYSIFTSGSTGIPKGVVIAHRGVIDYIDWAIETFHIGCDSVIGNQAPFYFDNSTLDIYLMFATGATLDIIPEEYFIFPAKLVDYMNQEKITFIFWVPFALINVANFRIFDSIVPKYLKNVFFAGEVMPNKHLNYWRKHLPKCRYANLYGPTEITVDCTYYLVDREFGDDEPLPIGIACKNSGVIILKDDNSQAKRNEIGELCVRGSSLALGYFNDKAKTDNAFMQNPLNKHYHDMIYRTGDLVYENEWGEIIYSGRKDSQIKHNGYRVELGEIETAVLGSHMVDNCCVIYNFEKKEIVLFYQSKESLSMSEFRKYILTKIPRYMVPSVYTRVDKMELNSNGKIDRLFYKKIINK